MAKLTLAQVKEKSAARLQGLHPTVYQKAVQLIENSYNRGVMIRIVQGLRTLEEQAKIYAQGRTAPGPIVSNAKPGYSYHNFGLAIDFCLLSDDGSQVYWDTRRDGDKDGTADWLEVAQEAKKLGFAWGGDWKDFPDYPHLEITFGLTTAQLRAGVKPPTGGTTIPTPTPTVPKPSTPDTTPPIVPYPGHTLQQGSTGKDVERVQRALGLNPDGTFGPATEQALKAYQSRKGLVSDGIVGLKTWDMLF